MPNKIVALCSGGLDSKVLAYRLTEDGSTLHLLHFDFQKESSRHELAAAKATALELGCPLEIVNLDGFTRMQLGYLPTEYVMADELDTGSHPCGPKDIRAFAVVVAAGIHFAEIVGADTLAIAAIKEQVVALPSLREFFGTVGHVVGLLNPSLSPASVSVPFLKTSKADIVKLGKKLRVPMEASWSCYLGNDVHCGACANCRSRKKAFTSARVKDPTRYLR
jgi:7-cyano-7-deazaguanine synthase